MCHLSASVYLCPGSGSGRYDCSSGNGSSNGVIMSSDSGGVCDSDRGSIGASSGGDIWI